ncbi:hypothetical protein NQ176_g1753 [Zarea fungicola]|uniref:Uncharacterized protein n=1 Tax=Zarea fungicola TaxID=93591 RepID=A0ACC1NSN2_9HYPO|nr:hypothetical protein NQ176_g1753 [Lecanicillium fungicola]
MSQTILVTGANGYVALHVIKRALAEGFQVIGTVRSALAASKVKAIFPNKSTALILTQIHNITEAESFEQAFTLAPITAVINTASPLINDPLDVRADVLDPAIQSGVAILKAVSRFGGSSCKRVIHVSSFTACRDLSLGNAPGKVFTPNDWNPLTYEEAADGGNMTAYMGSKALAERSMWDWMRENKASFDFVSVNPSAIFGPHVGSVDLDNLNVSTRMLWELVVPSPNPTPYNSRHLGSWVDVRDVAAALLQAVKVPEAGGERFLAAQRCHWQLIRDKTRELFPELARRIDAGEPGSWEAARDSTYNVDGSKVQKLLSIQYRTIEECLRDAYSQLLEAEKQEQAATSTHTE